MCQKLHNLWTKKTLTLGEKFILSLLLLLHFIWPSNLLILLLRRIWPLNLLHCKSLSLSYMTFYAVLAWFMLFKASWFPSWFVVCAIGFRIVDILLHRLYRVFFLRERPRERALMTLLVHLYELVFGYAILYFLCGCIVNQHGCPLASPMDALYFSAVTMATEGYGDFLPGGDPAHWLVISQLAVEVVFVIAIVPEVVRLFSGGDRPNTSESL